MSNPSAPIPFPVNPATLVEDAKSKEAFDEILRGLGRLSVAYNHLDQEIFDALAFLLASETSDPSKYAPAVVAADMIRGFEQRCVAVENLCKLSGRETAEIDKLNRILKRARTLNEKRNQFLHSRWGMPVGKTVAVRAKFKGEKDTYTDVSQQELDSIVKETEECKNELNSFFSRGAFSDYWDWSLNRLLPE
jgi:hypothetical protein